MSDRGWLIALAILSLALPVGWSWFRASSTQPGSWLRFNEQWVGATARIFYFVGLPYLALTSGLLTARFLGLKGLEHFVFASAARADFSLNSFLAELQQAVSLLLLECLIDGGVIIQAALLALLIMTGVRFGLASEGLTMATSFQPAMVSTLYEGLHWAFYWAIFWQLSGDLYLGVVWGVIWVLLEWTLTAWVQKSSLPQRPALLWRIILLILTATLFFYRPNLWLLWFVHLVLTMDIKSWYNRDIQNPA